MTAPTVDGLVEPGFGAVADAFAANFAEHGEVGAAYAVYVDGRPVVDVWGGLADPATGRRWLSDTVVLTFSITKGVTAVLTHLLAERGLLDLAAPVARYWPEFADAGKEAIPVEWLLSHQAGLPYVDTELTYDEALAWEPVVRALERQAPLWPPGTAHGYHARTFGWLVGEVLRRVSGRSVGRLLADELAGPLGLDFWIGLPEELEPRVAPIVGSTKLVGDDARGNPKLKAMWAELMGPDTMLGRTFAAPGGALRDGHFNDRALRAAELPSVGGVGDARSLARLYAATIGDLRDGQGRVLSAAQVERARTRVTSGPDQVLFIESTFGLGFMTSSPFAPYGGAGAFGHAGFGGGVAFADPDNGIAAAYVLNRTLQNLSGDPRSRALIKATYASAGAPIAFV